MTTRRESVQLSLVDAGFSTGMARAAASAALLDKQLNRLDGTQIQTTRSTDRLSESAVMGSRSIDRFSGRMGILLKLAGTLGPALIPIGAVGVPAVTGLANQFGFAAIAAGTAIAAFQGVGDALKTVNDAALEPSVANLEKAHDALKALSPAGRAMVAQLQEMRPVLTELRDSAAAGLFPGVIEGLESLEKLAPALTPILTTVGDALGDIFAAGADSLTSSRWADFFAVLATNARPVLMDMASAIGDVVHGLSEMTEAFMPLNRDFGSWLADGARGFDEWATGLSQTEGFTEFVDYIRENGPKLAEATQAIANALLQIVEAAAPLGGPVLDAIASIAEAIATIADSPLGTPIMAAVTALSAYSLAANVATAATLRLKAAQTTLGVGGAGKATGAGTVVGAGAKSFAPAAIALGLMDAAPDYIENLSMMINGERGVVEGMARMVAGGNPLGAALNILGVDILGVDDDATTLATTLAKTAKEQVELGSATDHTQAQVRRFGNTFFAANKELLTNARQTERLRKIIQDSNQAIAESASVWGDYSQKVELGTTGLDAVIDRMRTLGEAAANEAENIRRALKRGVDPQVIQSLYDTLGPQGAVLALDQLAHATRDRVREVENAYGAVRGGERAVEHAMRGVNEAITGSREKLRDLGREKAEPTVDLDDAPLRGKVASAERLLLGFDRKRPEPEADVDISGVQNGVASAERLLLGFDGRTATATITTYHRDIYQQLGNNNIGSRAPLASGGTVRGQREPYGDKVLAYLAPGEEVISNRWGQADRHRDLLKAINANRLADGGSVRVAARGVAGGGGTSRVHHTFEVRVVPGEMDLRKAKAQFTALVRDEIDQDRTFAESQR